MKNYLLGVIFLIIAFYMLWQQGAQQVEQKERSFQDELTETISAEYQGDGNVSIRRAKEKNIAIGTEVSSGSPFVSAMDLER